MKPNAPRRRSRLSRSVAAVLAAAGIASAAVTGLLYPVGVAGGSTRTVVMSPGQSSGGSDPGGSLDASSLYRRAAPAVVAVEATGTSSGSNNGFPYTPPAMASAYAVLRRDQVPEATSVLNTLQRVGGSIGTALLAVVLSDQAGAVLGSTATSGGLLQTLSPTVRAQVAAPLPPPSATRSGGRSARAYWPSFR
jgi:hypothetical protein